MIPVLGPFRIYREVDKASWQFNEFKELYLRRQGSETSVRDSIELEGDITTEDSVFRLESAKLNLTGDCFCDLQLTSKTVDGVHFALTGTFYDRPQRRANMFVHFRGTLKRFYNGKVVNTGELELVNWSEE